MTNKSKTIQKFHSLAVTLLTFICVKVIQRSRSRYHTSLHHIKDTLRLTRNDKFLQTENM